MRSSNFIGHVGGLAVALGVGTAVVIGFGSGIASADTTGSSGSTSSSSTDSSGSDNSGSKTSGTDTSGTSGTETEMPSTQQDGTASPATHRPTFGSRIRAAVRHAPGTRSHRDEDPDVTDGNAVSAFNDGESRRTERKDDAAGDTFSEPDVDASGAGTTSPESGQGDALVGDGGAPAADEAEVISNPEELLPSNGSEEKTPLDSLAKPSGDGSGTVAAAINTGDQEASTVEVVSIVLEGDVDPASFDPEPAPNDPPEALTMLGLARREVERTIDTPMGLAGSAAISQQTLDQQTFESAFTGQPSLISAVAAAGLSLVKVVTDFLGLDFSTHIAPLLATDHPPFFLTFGLNVQREEFGPDRMPVYRIESPLSALFNPSAADDVVVAIHGGAYVTRPTILHWANYSVMAWATGATVVVPMYPLATQGGTAGTAVPQVADLISREVTNHPNGRVSVYGDSAGGGLALAAAQHLVARQQDGDTEARLPAAMVLISPWLDVSMTNPVIPSVNDPILNAEVLRRDGLLWAGELRPDDEDYYLASPLYGSLEGLPPTYVYAGSLDMLAPDAVLLKQKATDEGAPFSFVLRRGLIHDWAMLPITPEGIAVLPNIYQHLVGTNFLSLFARPGGLPPVTSTACGVVTGTSQVQNSFNQIGFSCSSTALET